MSQKHDFRGFVVGSNRGGKEWVVRIKDSDPSWHLKKLTVGSVHVGTTLRKGLDVSFRLSVPDGYAHDVTELPQAEGKTRQKYDPTKRSAQASLNLAVIRGSDGSCAVFCTQAISYEEARGEYLEAGTETDEVLDFISLDVPPELEGAFQALSSLVWMNISDEEGFGQVIERVLSQVYAAGYKQH